MTDVLKDLLAEVDKLAAESEETAKGLKGETAAAHMGKAIAYALVGNKLHRLINNV